MRLIKKNSRKLSHSLMWKRNIKPNIRFHVIKCSAEHCVFELKFESLAVVIIFDEEAYYISHQRLASYCSIALLVYLCLSPPNSNTNIRKEFLKLIENLRNSNRKFKTLTVNDLR